MRVGYACQTLGVPGIAYRTCLQKNAAPEMLETLISHNLRALETAVRYNMSRGIRLFRITSDLIPFGSSPINRLPWPARFAEQLSQIGGLILNSGMRVSMHPGQYTVLNSPDPGTVSRAITDLAYHGAVLSGLGLDATHKIIVHIGGTYGDKPQAAARFAAVWRGLPELVRQRLVIENDDRSYTTGDVLTLGTQLQIPVVFDNLHHQLNPSVPQRPDREWILACGETWRAADGRQKIHYSQQAAAGKRGAHSHTIAARPFLAYCRELRDLDLDIMLEVKDKNLSAQKCLICLDPSQNPTALEQEWARYKYTILERSPADYAAIRRLFREKGPDLKLSFFDAVDRALIQPVLPGSAENAALHVWGYFKHQASDRVKEKFFRLMERFHQGRISIGPVKRLLEELAASERQAYLQDSYYFYL